MSRSASLLIILSILGFTSKPSGAAVVRYVGGVGAFTSATIDLHASDIGRRSGINVGTEAEWAMTRELSLSTALEYTQRGWVVKGVPLTTGEIKDYPTRIDYLSFPILLQWSAAEHAVRPFVRAGPRLDALLSLHSTLYAPEDKKAFREVLFGGSVAAGVRFHKSSLPLLFSVAVRYNFDLSNIGKTAIGHLNYKSNAFDLWLGAGFALGQRAAQE